MFGFAVSKFALGKIIPFSSIIAALMTETIPLAPSRWPTLLFTEPMKSGSDCARPFVVDNGADNIAITDCRLERLDQSSGINDLLCVRHGHEEVWCQRYAAPLEKTSMPYRQSYSDHEGQSSMRVGWTALLAHSQWLVREGATNKDTNIFTCDSFLGHTRILEGFKGTFKKKSLLRIKCSSLLNGHIKERSIKKSRVFFKKVTTLCVDTSMLAGSRMVYGLESTTPKDHQVMRRRRGVCRHSQQ
ncbi:hypothetical protein KCU85_g170, partial [Aureobasidium melanogenum]